MFLAHDKITCLLLAVAACSVLSTHFHCFTFFTLVQLSLSLYCLAASSHSWMHRLIAHSTLTFQILLIRLYRRFRVLSLLPLFIVSKDIMFFLGKVANFWVYDSFSKKFLYKTEPHLEINLTCLTTGANTPGFIICFKSFLLAHKIQWSNVLYNYLMVVLPYLRSHGCQGNLFIL